MKKNGYLYIIKQALLNDVLNFKGKSTRTEFVYFCLFGWSIYSLCLWVSLLAYGREVLGIDPTLVINSSSFIGFISEALVLILIWIFFASISMTFRRCRDIGLIWLGFIQFVPIASFILLPFLLFKKGKNTNENTAMNAEKL